MRLNSTYSNLYDVFNSPYLEKVLGDGFRPLADTCHILKDTSSSARQRLISQAGRGEVTSGSCQIK